MIYFVECQEAGAIKVGFTEDWDSLFARFAVLRCGCPLELKLLASLDGTRADEARWHLYLWSSRVRGEWFKTSHVLRELAKVGIVFEGPVSP